MTSFDHLIISTFPLCLLLILHSTTTTTTLSPPPPPLSPTNILEKSGQYTILLNLFHITQVTNQLNTQLKNSNQGITIFAPTDNAFSALKPGLLNSLSDQQKVELVQFHLIPTYLSLSQFETITNPIRTQAGDTTRFEFPLNITTARNQVNVSTGVVDTTVANTIYSDRSLAVYEVDKVLLPMKMFGPPAPVPKSVPESKNKKSDGDGDEDDGSSSARADVSSVVSLD